MPERPCSFPRACRLAGAKDFSRVFAEPVKSKNRYFLVFGRRNGLDRARLGLIVSKKRIRRAVARNRVKRVIRETFRSCRTDLSDLDIVVMAFSDANEAMLPQLRQSLRNHFRRIGKVAPAAVEEGRNGVSARSAKRSGRC